MPFKNDILVQKTMDFVDGVDLINIKNGMKVKEFGSVLEASLKEWTKFGKYIIDGCPLRLRRIEKTLYADADTIENEEEVMLRALEPPCIHALKQVIEQKDRALLLWGLSAVESSFRSVETSDLKRRIIRGVEVRKQRAMIDHLEELYEKKTSYVIWEEIYSFINTSAHDEFDQYFLNVAFREVLKPKKPLLEEVYGALHCNGFPPTEKQKLYAQFSNLDLTCITKNPVPPDEFFERLASRHQRPSLNGKTLHTKKDAFIFYNLPRTHRWKYPSYQQRIEEYRDVVYHQSWHRQHWSRWNLGMRLLLERLVGQDRKALDSIFALTCDELVKELQYHGST